jgi:hypothetical protein
MSTTSSGLVVPSVYVKGEAGSPVAVVSLPAEGGRRRRPPAGPALSS